MNPWKDWQKSSIKQCISKHSYPYETLCPTHCNPYYEWNLMLHEKTSPTVFNLNTITSNWCKMVNFRDFTAFDFIFTSICLILPRNIYIRSTVNTLFFGRSHWIRYLIQWSIIWKIDLYLEIQNINISFHFPGPLYKIQGYILCKIIW